MRPRYLPRQRRRPIPPGPCGLASTKRSCPWATFLSCIIESRISLPLRLGTSTGRPNLWSSERIRRCMGHQHDRDVRPTATHIPCRWIPPRRAVTGRGRNPSPFGRGLGEGWIDLEIWKFGDLESLNPVPPSPPALSQRERGGLPRKHLERMAERVAEVEHGPQSASSCSSCSTTSAFNRQQGQWRASVRFLRVRGVRRRGLQDIEKTRRQGSRRI